MIDQIVQDIEKQGWSYIPGAISPERLSELEVLFGRDFTPARVGHQTDRQRVESIRGDFIHWLDPLSPPQELADEIEFLNKLKQEVNQRFFLGLKDFECHLAKYPPGSFYKKHLDRFAKDSSRSLTFIYYLHQEWNKEDGGELILYNQDGEVLQTILPAPGSLVCFLAEDFPHEVKTSFRERRSFTGWMHTKILT